MDKINDPKTTTPAPAPAVVPPVVEPKAVAASTVTTVPQLTVDKDVVDALQSSLDKKIGEMAAKDNQIKELTANIEKMQKDVLAAQEMSTKIQAKYDEAIAKLNKIEADVVETARKAKINERIATLAKVVEVNDSNRPLFESEAATLSDDDFAKKVELYKQLTKKVDASVAPEDPKSVKTTVQEAVVKAAEATPKTDIVTAPVNKSLAEQFRENFGKPEDFGLQTK